MKCRPVIHGVVEINFSYPLAMWKCVCVCVNERYVYAMLNHTFCLGGLFICTTLILLMKRRAQSYPSQYY